MTGRLGCFTHQNTHPIGAGDPFEAGPQVDRIAHHGIGLADFGAHVTDGHIASTQAQTHFNFRPAPFGVFGFELGQLALHG